MNQSKLEEYFAPFREKTIGNKIEIPTSEGNKRLVYADWTASGRLYTSIEERIKNDLGPFVANTHTETTFTGTLMTLAYQKAKKIIKEHVHAGPEDVILTLGSGMTTVVNKFQRMLGLKICDKMQQWLHVPDQERPVVFVTHMEHHSNHTSWQETIADVVIIPPTEDGLVSLPHFKELLEQYKDRKIKYAAVTACSNVTGIQPDCRSIARLIHQYGGYCFVDYACSAPYVEIKMHTGDPSEKFDAIYFSPHKFLGGPGSAGVIVFDRKLYDNKTPDVTGGGTVTWTDAWGDRIYYDDIEMREDGGTPSFLQAIRAAFSVKLKEEIGVENMLAREEEMLDIIFNKLDQIPNLHILAGNIKNRLGVISFYIEDLHYNLGVKLLNDRFGIQVRGGCVCAGTYGHYLFEVSKELSDQIQLKVLSGDLSAKPGWIRLSIHPIMTNDEIEYICDSIKLLTENHKIWGKEYAYNKNTNEFFHLNDQRFEHSLVEKWFEEV